MLRAGSLISILLSVGLALGACQNSRPEARSELKQSGASTAVSALSLASGAPSTAAPASASAPVTAAVNGNAARGIELVKRFECSRCHDGAGVPSSATEQHCTHCHQDILAGKFKASTTKLEKWQKHVTWVRDVPSLAAIGNRLTPNWIEHFLLEPHDLRPNLAQTMPRLKLTQAEARDIAAYLTRDRAAPKPVSFAGADLATGRELFELKGCGSCHRFGGVPEFATKPRLDGPERDQRAASLAPDLRHARERFRPDQIVRWIMDPKAIKSDTLMTPSPLSEGEAREIANYILNAPLEPEKPKPIPARLPVLTRKVSYDEVYERVLSKTCRHCHSNPDVSFGDGGPGNTGGFGFAARGLNLATYSGIAAGLLNEKRERESAFKKLSDGTPRVLAALLARQAEEAGKPNPEVRGMPLSLPSLPPEDIQLFETWIAQGRPK